MGHFLFYFWDSFFWIPFNLSQYEMTKFSALGPRKSVQRPHMSPYLDMRWEWFWVQNPSGKPFNGKFLWIWCLNLCKCAHNTYFWKFHENWTLRFLKKWHFGSQLSVKALFKIIRKIFFFRSFKVYRCEDKPKLDLISSLSTVLIRTFIWMPPLNCT